MSPPGLSVAARDFACNGRHGFAIAAGLAASLLGLGTDGRYRYRYFSSWRTHGGPASKHGLPTTPAGSRQTPADGNTASRPMLPRLRETGLLKERCFHSTTHVDANVQSRRIPT